MKNLLALCCGLMLSLTSFFALAQEADVAAIYALLDRIEQAFAAGDIDGAMSVFTDDAIILQDDGPDIAGADAIRATYAGMLAQFDVDVDFATTEVEVSGDLAFEHGTFTLRLTDKASGQLAVETTSRHVHIYKREADGSWKTWRMMTNGLAPAAAP